MIINAMITNCEMTVIVGTSLQWPYLDTMRRSELRSHWRV